MHTLEWIDGHWWVVLSLNADEYKPIAKCRDVHTAALAVSWLNGGEAFDYTQQDLDFFTHDKSPRSRVVHLVKGDDDK